MCSDSSVCSVIIHNNVFGWSGRRTITCKTHFPADNGVVSKFGCVTLDGLEIQVLNGSIFLFLERWWHLRDHETWSKCGTDMRMSSAGFYWSNFLFVEKTTSNKTIKIIYDLSLLLFCIVSESLRDPSLPMCLSQLMVYVINATYDVAVDVLVLLK